MKKVTVRVPATSANLGPGFDSVGLAFNLYNIISFEESNDLIIEGCEDQYKNENNLAYYGFYKTLLASGKEQKNVKIIFEQINIPVSRGLGSSSSLLVAGAIAANTLYNLRLTKFDILRICNKIEGHPDNLSPALFGGLTASMMADGVPYSVSYNIHKNLSFVALVPNFTLLTSVARTVLPKTISFQDAVFNESRVAILLKALEMGNEHLISISLDDKIHQPYRKHLIPGYDTVEEIVKKNGALAFCISGAGSTCLCVTSNTEFFCQKVHKELKEKGFENWDIIPLSVDYEGAKVI